MTLYQIHDLINNEGPILTLLKDDSDSIYVMGISENGYTKVITQTNSWIIEQFLRSRLKLKEIFILSQDQHFITISEGRAKAQFFRISTICEPKEIAELSFGDFLYEILPKGVRSGLNTEEILGLLPNQIAEEKPFEIETLAIADSDVQFFQDGPVRTISVQSNILNSDEHDYIQCNTLDGKKILTKVNPHSLFLLLNNRVSIKEIFLLRKNDEFIVLDGDSITVSKYSFVISSILRNVCYSDLTYFSLPKKLQIENPIENWKYYVNNVTISGKGILEPGFKSIYPLEVNIIKANPNEKGR